MHPLQTLLIEAGLEPRSYSGRGMMGRECLSVDVDRGGLGTLIAGIVRGLQSDAVADVDPEEVADALENLSTDSMGLGQVVYFPGVPFEGTEDSDENEEDEK